MFTFVGKAIIIRVCFLAPALCLPRPRNVFHVAQGLLDGYAVAANQRRRMDPTRTRELFPSSRDRWVHVVKDPLSSGRKGKALDVRSTFPFCKLGLGIRFPRSTLGGSAFQGRGKHGDWFPPAFGGWVLLWVFVFTCGLWSESPPKPKHLGLSLFNLSFRIPWSQRRPPGCHEKAPQRQYRHRMRRPVFRLSVQDFPMCRFTCCVPWWG